MKILKRCRCKDPVVCGFGATRCLTCGGALNFNLLKALRQYDRDNGIVRDKNGVIEAEPNGG
jgi:hypothetical protein